MQSTFARAALVSLWKVLDRETAAFMRDFYQDVLQFKQRRISASYMATMRRYCRRDRQRVHPYYWAGFVFIDGEYRKPDAVVGFSPPEACASDRDHIASTVTPASACGEGEGRHESRDGIAELAGSQSVRTS